MSGSAGLQRPLSLVLVDASMQHEPGRDAALRGAT
jgi:hypothetical protein